MTDAPLLHLALDTGSPTVSVALARGGAVMAERSVAMDRSSALLLALVQEVLTEAGARLGDLAGIAALRGPGSFTGLRIGLATVLGLHQALGVPATAIPTLHALALTASGTVIAAVDALRGDWTAQAFVSDPGLPVPRPLGEAVLIPGPDLPSLAAGDERIVTGFGVSRLGALPGWPADLRLVEAGPLAGAAARLAADPATVWDPSLLTAPLYARPPAVTTPRPRRTARPLSIRPVLPDDLRRIAWLEESAFKDSWPYDLVAYELTNPRALMLLAEWNGEPAPGYISLRHGGGESEILRLAVDPAARRRGVARALVDEGLARLRGLKVESCHLEVRMDNEGAIAFYHSLGFARSGRRRHYYRDGTDALVLSRALSRA
ncbi:MAG TPA: tRNA (adenosine(37)-N6)-threonylcarbamoyltransferase complex dimerization subunit type 1 TsaB [Thermoanaerobaculia bacterium]|jgi:N6-L-threonylcarbamoyladenine synthase|nr:tRNA (adenosine(37)-N6)-threonylcarbamoyltransferase complex dimerization subunit type 1 TsaB [Thermoanaerobaculia bacterium]